jgi:hypothetical protein
MGTAPDDKKIERILNNGNYEPGNCCWATHEEQMQNTRSTVPIVLDGVTMSVSKACRLLGLKKCNFDTHYKRKYNRNKEFAQKCFEETRTALSKRSGHRIPW